LWNEQVEGFPVEQAGERNVEEESNWDHLARKLAAKHFKLEQAEMEVRHHLTFEVFEVRGPCSEAIFVEQ
jgi:hypothetical protein